MAATAQHEELVSLLVDLPDGTHAQVVGPRLDAGLALLAAAEVARDAREQLLAWGFGDDRARGAGATAMPPFDGATWAPMLREAAASARAAGFAGVQGLVLAAASMAVIGAQGHAVAERALGPRSPAGVRLVCYFGPEDVARLGSEAPGDEASHSVVYRLRGGG